MAIRLVMLGDIVGNPGCCAVRQLIPTIRNKWRPDIILANAENAADGSGITPALFNSLRAAGIDAMTLGDHCFRKAQIFRIIDHEDRLSRPANLPAPAKGRRWLSVRSSGRNVYVITLLGRVLIDLPSDNAFNAIDQILRELPDRNPIVIVEVHAETTAEKIAMRWHLDGRVAAVLGTHTHVPTADACITEGGTGYITDLGMCGPWASVIGRRADRVVKYQSTGMPSPFEVADGDPRVAGIYLEIDEVTGRSLAIERIELKADPRQDDYRLE